MTNSPNNNSYEYTCDLSPDDLRLTASPAKRRHHTHTVTISDNASECPDLLVRSSHRPHKKKKKQHPVIKALIAVAACLLGIVVIAVSTVMVLQRRGQASLLPDASVSITAPTDHEQNVDVEVSENGRVVKYNGNTYTFNENRTNILCIGVDKDTLGLQNDIVGTGGQSDALILLSVDTATGNMDALAVSRDTLVDIDLFAEDGSFVGTERTQICLAYAYGDGREGSCDATVRAVSRLLYGIPINTYFAIDLQSICTLNDAVGGVEVNLSSDFRHANGSTSTAGQFITLYGDDALRFVRARDTEQLDSNNDRMYRQKQYLSAFAEKAILATKADMQVPLALYNTVKGDSITSLSPAKITFLATSLVRHNLPLQFHSVAGDVVKGDDGYAEFIVNETALYEQVLDIFYTKQ